MEMPQLSRAIGAGPCSHRWKRAGQGRQRSAAAPMIRTKMPTAMVRMPAVVSVPWKFTASFRPSESAAAPGGYDDRA